MAGGEEPRRDERSARSGILALNPGRQPLLIGYWLCQATLVVFGVSTADRHGEAVAVWMMAFGLVTVSVCLIIFRLPRALTWWTIASGFLILAAVRSADVFDGSRTDLPSPPLWLLVVAASAGVVAVGLGLLGRCGKQVGMIDMLDAAMIAAATLLVAWIFVADVVEPERAEFSSATLIVVVSTFAVLTTMAKVTMSVGLRTPALALLVLATAAFLASTADLLVPDIPSTTAGGPRASKMLWSVDGVLLGAAALHASSTRKQPAPRRSATELPSWRIALFAAIAVVVPLALSLDLVHRSATPDRSIAGVTGPTVAAATVLLLLVGRLAMTARTSDRRAATLARRTDALAQAIDRQDTLQHQLAYRATHDPLTGLANRLVLAEQMETKLAPGGDGRRLCALLLLDLDGFKDINDTRGHPTGDDLLTAVAQRLVSTAPSDALVARLGGDEFAMLFDVAKPADATARAEEILEAIRPPFTISDQELFVSASIGLLLTDTSQEPTTPSNALRDADLSLYAAKNAGKNRIVTFRPELRAARMEHARISAGLHHALSRHEITLHYQTIVDLRSDTVFAVEALARWHPLTGNTIAPSQFIPVAEATGMINALGGHVLRTACDRAKHWYQTYGVAVSVNVSGQQLSDPNFADLVISTLADTGMPAAGLILELTESSLVRTSAQQSEFRQLARLRNLGVRIAIDDFGTGYSSLSYILDLPVDIVKLDRSFAHYATSAPASEPNWAFTGAILQVIASLGLQAITEGVETTEQVQKLRQLHCPYGQGFLFSVPAPPTEIDQLLAESQ